MAHRFSAGFKVYSHRVRKWPSFQKAHNGQFEVNVGYPSAEKTVFSGRIAKTFRKTAASGTFAG
jgi:hypothetical protein